MGLGSKDFWLTFHWLLFPCLTLTWYLKVTQPDSVSVFGGRPQLMWRKVACSFSSTCTVTFSGAFGFTVEDRDQRQSGRPQRNKTFYFISLFFCPLERHLTNVHHVHLEGVWSGIPQCIVGHHRQVVVHPDKSVAPVEETWVLSCRLVVWTLVRSL